MNWLVTIPSVLGAVSFLGTIFVALSNRRKIQAEAGKTGADAAAILTETALKAAEKSIAQVEKQATKLMAELEGAQTKMHALQEHMEVLQDLLRSAGIAAPTFRYPPLRFAGSKDNR